MVKVVASIIVLETIFVYFIVTGLTADPVRWDAITSGACGTVLFIPLGVEYYFQRKNKDMNLKWHTSNLGHGKPPSRGMRVLLRWGPWGCGLMLGASALMAALQITYDYGEKPVIWNAAWSLIWVYGIFKILNLRKRHRLPCDCPER